MFESPLRSLSDSQVEEMKLKFYNSDIHRAAFALPQFVKKVYNIYIENNHLYYSTFYVCVCVTFHCELLIRQCK